LYFFFERVNCISKKKSNRISKKRERKPRLQSLLINTKRSPKQLFTDSENSKDNSEELKVHKTNINNNKLGGIKQKDIVDWYLDSNIDDIKSVEQATQMTKIVHSIIQRLITQEKALIVVTDDGDYKERMLELQPNFYDNA
jgi:hypothetical protein